MKLLFDPPGTDFRLLRWAGTFMTVIGCLLFLVLLLWAAWSFLRGGIGLIPVVPLISLVYALTFVVAGQLLHWLVAMWQSRQKTNALLEQRNRGSGAG